MCFLVDQVTPIIHGMGQTWLGARGADVDQLMQQRFLPTGRSSVRYFAISNYWVTA